MYYFFDRVFHGIRLRKKYTAIVITVMSYLFLNTSTFYIDNKIVAKIKTRITTVINNNKVTII